MHSRVKKTKNIIQLETPDNTALLQEKLKYLSKMIPLGSMAYFAVALIYCFILYVIE